MAYDLCDVHADALTVPRGWVLEDRRQGRRPVTSLEDAFAY
jgi:hypothetical protein